MNPIVATGLAVGGMGVACGAVLALAARFLAVHEDPRVERVLELLPGANCGGCGFAGCADYAKALVLENAPLGQCAPGGPEVVRQVAAFLGRQPVATVRKVALVLCGGDLLQAPRKARYNGVADCSTANAVAGGDKACRYGCLGYGSCALVCPTQCISLENGLAVVDPDACIACGACVKACPRGLISLVPAERAIHVLCRNRDKGPEVRKVCKVGCIACGRCANLAENEAIRMDGFLAVVDYDKALANREVVEKCPTKCIRERSGAARAADRTGKRAA